MIKRLVALITTMLLIISLLPVFAFASNVSLTLSNDTAIVGDSITASGSADSDTWVSIKVLDSAQNITVYDAVKANANGEYICIFTVPDVSAGSLTVIAGYGTNVASKTLTITSSAGGGAGGSTKSNNANLASLVTNMESLTPSFDPSITNYSIILSAGTTVVPTITATRADTKATVQITKATQLSGSTEVKVTAEDGTVKTYSISFVVRQAIVITNPGTQQTVNVPVSETSKNFEIPAIDPSNINNVGLNMDIPSGVEGATISVQTTSHGANNEATLPQLTITSSAANVNIPAGTTVSGSSGWNGTINVPEVKANSTVTVVADSGKTATVSSVVEVGYGDIPLTFDKAVKILIPDQAGKDAGYSRGGIFAPITTVLTATSQADVDAELLAKGVQDGKQDSGSDLVIWTKHFTKFASYTQTATTSSSSGGGGGGGGANSDQQFTASFATSSLNPANTVLQFDFSNGIDQNLSACLSQIHVKAKSGNTPVQYSSQNYIKQGSGSDTIKIRRLELTFNNLQPGTAYVVEMDPDFSANNGNKIAGTIRWEFTTTATAVTTPVNQGITTTGGVVSDFGAIVAVPSNAFGSEIKVTLKQISNTSGLPLPANSRLIGGVIEVSKDIAGNFSKPVTVSMSFNPSQIDLDKYNLSIYWLDATAGQWVKLDNIKINMTAGTVSGEVIHFTNFALIATEKVLPGVSLVSFNDIADHWAEAYINQMVAIGATGGYPDGSFQPNANISRAEFVTMLVKAFGLEMKTGKVFDDTANSWAKEYVATACANGITGGYSDSLFGTEDSITREQMAVMLVKAAHLSSSGSGKAFTDDAITSSWAKEAVNIVTARQIMTGYADGTFGSQNFATRAEAVTVLALSSK